MIIRTDKGKRLVKKIALATVALLLIGMAATWYIFNEKYEDTAVTKADYTVNALEFMNEFKMNGGINPAANKKYSEKIIIVNGRVTEIETPDSTINIKMTDTDGTYIAFAFQPQDQAAVKNVKQGDSVSVKGSCNGGTFSTILEVPSITFKRCSLNK